MTSGFKRMPFVLGLSVAVIALVIFSAGSASARSLAPPEIPEDALDDETGEFTAATTDADWRGGSPASAESPLREKIETAEAESAQVGICLVGVESPCNSGDWEADTTSDRANARSQGDVADPVIETSEFTTGFETVDQTHETELKPNSSTSMDAHSAWLESTTEESGSTNQTKGG